MTDDDGEELILVLEINVVRSRLGSGRCRWPLLGAAFLFLKQLVGLVLIKVTLLIILGHEHRENQVTVLQEELLHRCAVIEELLDDPEDLIPVLEVGGEPVNVNQDVNDRNVSQEVKLSLLEGGLEVWHLAEQELGLFVDVKVELAQDHFVELLEDAILGCALVLLVLSLDDLVHAIQVLLEPDLVHDEIGVAFLIKLFVFPGHVHVLDLVV